MKNYKNDKILILDFGSQYTALIARRVRELGIYSEIHPHTMSANEIKAFNPKAIILSGGPATASHQHAPKAPECVFTLSCPVLGICYGMQTMAEQLGGRVIQSTHHEYGLAQLSVHSSSALLSPGEHSVWMSHGDQVVACPPGFQITAQSNNTPIAAMEDPSRHFYGLQFHPEVTHTPRGDEILQRFCRDIAKCDSVWTPKNILTQSIERIREQVGSDQVILGLSGGVDSAVAAVLIQQAIGDQLRCVFVDTGLLQKNEVQRVEQIFSKQFHLNLTTISAAPEFYQALSGVSDPEAKRKICGKVFVDIFQRVASGLKDIKWLAQGTIYPDVIESANIKTHHNVGGLPESLHLKILEPLRALFKDEVRALGLALGIPAEILSRHPFPGPGLAVRIMGEVKEAYANILREADAIFLEELVKHDLYHQVGQAFAVFLPLKSVGVTGDNRNYNYVIALRAVTTTDFMTASVAPLPHDFLTLVSNRIVNEVKGVSRVCYDTTTKPPATIEWE